MSNRVIESIQYLRSAIIFTMLRLAGTALSMAARSISDLGAFWGTWSGSASTENSISGSRKLKPEARLKRGNRLVGRGSSSTRAAPPASRSWRLRMRGPLTAGRSHAGAEPLGKRPRVNFRVGKAAVTGSICGRRLEVDARHPGRRSRGEKRADPALGETHQNRLRPATLARERPGFSRGRAAMPAPAAETGGQTTCRPGSHPPVLTRLPFS
jgi:hypothetical protein